MQIVKTYSGKIGCMCGCRGKYAYTEFGIKSSGVAYETANERSAKIIAGKVMKTPENLREVMDVGDGMTGIFVEDRVRGTIKVVFYR